MFIANLKAKMFKTERRNRCIASIISFIFIFVLTGPVIANATTIRVDNKHNSSTMRYLEFSNGKAIFFPTKIIKGTDTEVYCLQHQKLSPQGQLYTSDDGAGTIDGGVRYILAQNPNTGDKNKDYYIKQLALQYYLGQVPEVKKCVDSPVKRAILKIANDAKKHTSDPLVPDLELSPSNPEFKYYPATDDYETQWIYVKTIGDINKLYSKLKAPKGVEIVLPNGKVVSNLGKNDTKFYLRVPANAVTSDFSVKMGVRGDFNATEVTSFVPKDTEYQKIAYPKETVVKGNKDSYLTATLKMVPGAVEIIKTNENGNVLSGAKFKLVQNDKVIATGTTDNNGKLVFSNIPKGDYQVIEEQAPTGYLISNQATNVKVSDSKTSTVKVTDKVITGKIRITKTDSKDGKKLQGAEFQVINKATNKVVQTLTTGADGTATTGNLEYGQYIIKETKAPDKYTLNGKEYIASISENEKIVDVNVGNNIITGKIQISKEDAETGAKLAGAEFQVINKATNKVVETVITDKNGVATTSDLPYGEYIVKETKAPEKYTLNGEQHIASINKDGALVQITHKDTIFKGKIKITKEDAETGTKLAGAEFQVIDKATNKVVQTVTTGADGTATTGDLPYGQYIVKETKAPEKYTLNGEQHAANIDKNGAMIEITHKDTIFKGKIKITKEDAETGAKLEGAEFQVINKVTNKVVQTVTTGADGTATTGDLPYGQYIVKETKAPEKYTLNGEQHAANIDKNGAMIEITHKDTIFKGKIKITKEDAETSEKLAGAEFQVINKATNKVVQTVTTGADGTATTGDLSYGEYIVKETKAPEKYTLNGEQHIANINRNGAVIEITHKDTIMKSSVQITKEDAETSAKLAGAEFQVINNATNKVVKTIITDKNGLATVDNLPFGEYVIKETKAPVGYTLNNETHKINVNKDGEVIKITHKDRIIKSKVQITKEDVETSAKLAGAEFQVIDKATNKVVQTVTTGADGTATTGDLSFGEYLIKEIKAPANYTLNNETHKIDVNKDGEIIKVTHKDRIIKSKIQITKEDAENAKKLKGAEFQVINKATNKVVQTITTESNGIAETNDLPFGEYIIKETKAPVGYTLNNETHNINIKNDGEIIKVTHKDKIIKSSIEIIKEDIETGSKLEGAKFQVIDRVSGQVIKTITTDKNGFARVNDLPFGKYTVKEIQAPDKYTLNSETHDIDVKNDGEVIKVTHKDRIIKGKIQVIKADVETGEKLEGAEFQVINKATNKVVQTITTDKNGIATTDNLNYGQYIIKETKAPAKYTLNGEEHIASITQDAQLITITHTDRIIKGKVSIKKFDKEIKNINLSGAEFTIFDSNNKIVDTLTTNNDGMAISKDLNYGNYTMKETKAPKGYLISNNVWKISITEDAKIYNFDIENQIIKGKIQILKLDAFNSHKVEGATFGVYAKNVSGIAADKLIETVTTDKNGTAITSDLRYGEYYLKEIKAPADYILSDITYPVSIIENGKIYTENITNIPVQARIKVLKIDGESKKPIANTEFKIVNLDTKKDVVFTEVRDNKVIGNRVIG
ncbi:MAG: SpaA isopeptide-forming pilin-related protein, partial [bacterium]|nr:SpaA isopeptide-forming pilin-related protein [bacterium]